VDIGRLGRPYLSGQAARTPAEHSKKPNAELRRLIHEGFERGILGEQLADAAGAFRTLREVF
jgi:hypothetical protein